MTSAYRDKIYQNIIKQLRLAKENQDLQNKFKQLDSNRVQCIGAMELLAELFQEETGKPLQQVLNTDPEWLDLIKKAESEAFSIKEQAGPQLVEQQPEPQPARQQVDSEQKAAPEPTKLKKLSENKKPTQQVEQPALRSRTPVQIVINEQDDPGPGDIDDDA